MYETIMDLENACDNVNRKGSLVDLTLYGVFGKIITAVKSFFN